MAFHTSSQGIQLYPESETPCREITLRVTLSYTEAPFHAPPEWHYEHILEWALNHSAIQECQCIGFEEWVDLKPVNVKMRADWTDRVDHTSDSDDEQDYRQHCAARGDAPSQDGFIRHFLERSLGVTLHVITPPQGD